MSLIQMRVIYKNELDPREKKWCIYSHYNKAGLIDLYVIHALSALHDAEFRILFVSTSPVEGSEYLARLMSFVSILAVRENIGYDFGSYKLGIQFIIDHGYSPCQLLLTNDSIFGPFFDLPKILTEAGEFDMLGLTESFEIAYHLQSYFVLYNRNVLNSSAFTAFWGSVDLLEGFGSDLKQKIIVRYEIGGSQHFLKHGFSLKAAFPQSLLTTKIPSDLGKDKFSLTPLSSLLHAIPGYPLNPTHFYWKELVSLGFPYIKRELLFLNPFNVNIFDWPSTLSSLTQYDLALILLAYYNSSGADDFMYLLKPTWELPWKADESGVAVLEVCPELKNWSYLFNTPPKRRFDVKISFSP